MGALRGEDGSGEGSSDGRWRRGRQRGQQRTIAEKIVGEEVKLDLDGLCQLRILQLNELLG